MDKTSHLKPSQRLQLRADERLKNQRKAQKVAQGKPFLVGLVSGILSALWRGNDSKY